MDGAAEEPPSVQERIEVLNKQEHEDRRQARGAFPEATRNAAASSQNVDRTEVSARPEDKQDLDFPMRRKSLMRELIHLDPI